MNQQQKDNARKHYLAAGIMLPMLDTMISDANDRLMARYRTGDSDLTNAVARLEALNSIREEIDTQSKLYDNIKE